MNKLLLLGLPGVASLILLANSNQFIKDLGKIGIGATGAGLISLSVGTNTNEIDKLSKEKDDAQKTIEKLQKTVRLIDETRIDAVNKTEVAKQLASDLTEKHLKTTAELSKQFASEKHNLEIQINELKANLRNITLISTSTPNRIIEDTYKDNYQKVFTLIEGWIRNYPELAEFFEKQKIKVEAVQAWAKNEIKSYGQLDNVDDLLDTGLWIQSRIISRLYDIKVKGFSTIIKYYSEIAENSVTFEEYQRNLEDLANKAGEQIQSKDLTVRSIAQDWIDSNNGHKQKYENEFTELINQGQSANQYITELQNKLVDLENTLIDFKRPRKFSPATRDDLRCANFIIEYFEKIGFILDYGMSINHKYTATVYFQVDRNSQISIAELNSHSEKLMKECGTIAPVVFAIDDSGLIKTELKLATKEIVEKSAQFKPPTCKSIIEKSARGLLITGHPGAGKSSSMRYLGQVLGGQDAMRLALIPHAQDNQSFEDSGYLVINTLEQIYTAIIELKNEILTRGQSSKKDHRYLIVCIDELGKIIADAPKGLDVMEIIRQAAVEGRKLNIIVILGNHSQTTTAIDMDSQYRESFVQLWLCGAATHKINMPNAPQLKQAEIDWIVNNAYPALISINGKCTTIQHPTHSFYNEYQDKGLPPIGIENWESNNVLIGDLNIPARKRKVK